MFFWAPIVTLLHELGHAISAMLLTRRPILVEVGRRPTRLRFALGQLQINFGPSWNPLLLAAGSCSWPRTGISHWGHVFVLLSGPLASWHQLLFYNGMAVYLGDSLGGWMMQLATIMAFSSLAFTCIPMRYPAWMGGIGGRESDAMAAVAHLKAIRAARNRNH